MLTKEGGYLARPMKKRGKDSKDILEWREEKSERGVLTTGPVV